MIMCHKGLLCLAFPLLLDLDFDAIILSEYDKIELQLMLDIAKTR